ncbi:cell division ATPase MinD [Natronoarchaeum sp. GCM10025703]|uniref:cell division ATPase MinD n=1 Tax=unclassified Natronoarchaeum TaxID=2620183 RepID=UPI00360B8903
MSSTTVYAVASGKGGVGKTTTTVNLGTALAGAGHKVVLVDTDLGMANLAGFVNLSPDGPTLHDVLSGDATVTEATYEVAERIGAVPSGTELTSFAQADATRLREVIDQLRSEFDYVLLDVGAGISHESVLPLGIADATILVSTPEPASVQDVKKTVELAEQAGGDISGLVLTRTRSGDDVSYEQIAARLDLPLIGVIPEDDAVRDSVYARTPLVVNTPDSPAAGAYRELAAGIGGGSSDASEESPETTDEASAAVGAESSDVSDALSDVESDATAADGTDSADTDGDDIPDEDIDLSLEREGAESEESDPGAETEESDPGAETEESDPDAEIEESDVDVDAEESDEQATPDEDVDEQADVVADAESDSVEAAAGTVAPEAGGADSGAEASADGVTIPDAEADADAATNSSDDLADDAVPFRGGNSTAEEGDAPAEDGTDEDTAGEGEAEEDADEEDGKGFLGGLF